MLLITVRCFAKSADRRVKTHRSNFPSGYNYSQYSHVHSPFYFLMPRITNRLVQHTSILTVGWSSTVLHVRYAAKEKMGAVVFFFCNAQINWFLNTNTATAVATTACNPPAFAIVITWYKLQCNNNWNWNMKYVNRFGHNTTITIAIIVRCENDSVALTVDQIDCECRSAIFRWMLLIIYYKMFHFFFINIFCFLEIYS